MITEDNIKEINEVQKMIGEKIPYFEDMELSIVGDEYINLLLPGDDQSLDYTVEEFLSIRPQLEGFSVLENGRIHTKGVSYQIVKMEDSDLEHYLRKTEDFHTVEDVAELRLIEANQWVALACLQIGAYHEYGINYEEYSIVEVEYQNPEHKVDLEEETKLIYSYLFEIADSTGNVYYLSKIHEYDAELQNKIEGLYLADGDPDHLTEVTNLRPLVEYTDPIKLYISAMQTSDAELRLLNFYKIFEYYAPIVISIDSFDQLSKKLDSSKVLNPDRSFLKSIFDLVDASRYQLRDSELIKSVFSRCFDYVDIFNDLPESIQKKVLSNIKEKEMGYKVSKDKLLQASNYLSTIIYSTRNQVVHAKSNFTPTGEECIAKDVVQLNLFLQKASALTIRWYNKLPSYQRE